MAVHQVNPGGKLATLDPIWDRIRGEAEDIVHREPELATFIYSTVLHHSRLEDAVIHRVADRLDHSALSGDLVRQTYDEALRDDPDLGNAFRADLVCRLLLEKKKKTKARQGDVVDQAGPTAARHTGGRVAEG